MIRGRCSHCLQLQVSLVLQQARGQGHRLAWKWRGPCRHITWPP
jgi:hypothetical protein